MRRARCTQAELAVVVCVVLLASATSSWAKDEPDTKLPDNASGEAEVKPVPLVPEFVSPLEKVKKYQYLNVEGSAWKKANDNVGEIGGWSVYSRERPETEAIEESDKIEDSDKMDDPEAMSESELMEDSEKPEASDHQDSSTADHGIHQ